MAASTDYSGKSFGSSCCSFMPVFFFQFVAWTTTRLNSFCGDKEDS